MISLWIKMSWQQPTSSKKCYLMRKKTINTKANSFIWKACFVQHKYELESITNFSFATNTRWKKCECHTRFFFFFLFPFWVDLPRGNEILMQQRESLVWFTQEIMYLFRPTKAKKSMPNSRAGNSWVKASSSRRSWSHSQKLGEGEGKGTR